MRKNNFDFIRFFLALTVVFAHIIVLSQNPTLALLSPYFDSYISVTGFFIISGFLITQSYTNNPIKQYFIKRANRLLPGYFCTILLSTVLLSMVSTKNIDSYFLDSRLYKYLFYNITFLNFLQPCLPGVFSNNNLCAVNGALWTIKIEVGFYIIVPVIFYFICKIRKKIILYTVIYVASIVYKYVFEYYYYQTSSGKFDVLAHQLPAFMSYFVCGMVMYHYLPEFLSKKKYLIWGAILVFVTEKYFSIEILRPIALTIIIFYLAYGFKFLNNFGKNGDISFGIYIYHFPIIQLFVSLGLFSKYNPIGVLIFIVSIVIIAGILSWNLLEKRFLKHKGISDLKK